MKKMTALKAIRAKCIDCCAGQIIEVNKCTFEHCPLWFYRTGHNPNRKGLGNPTPAFKKKEPAGGEIIDEDI